MANEVIDFNAARDALKKAERAQAREQKQKAATEHEWEERLLFDDKGSFDRHAGANVTAVLTEHAEWRDAFYFDAFGGRIMIGRDCPAGKAGDEWTDTHDKLVSDWLQLSKYNLRPSKSDVCDSVNAVARSREVHPIRAYLSGLAWDGKPRVDLFATTYLGARASDDDQREVQYLAKVSSILLLGPVARVMRPGCMLKTVAILEGPQDLGKSRAIRALCPRDEWFSDSEIPYGSKDAFQGLRGKWLIELAEIDKDLKGRASASTIKAFISSPSDYFRDPFGRRFADNPRQGAFIGSTNQTEYLTDETGGSRWLPFTCGPPDVDGIVRDRDQLWAEAFHRFNAGECWWLDNAELLPFARDEQSARYAADVWTERVKRILTESEAPSVAFDADMRNRPEAGVTTEWILAQIGIRTADQGTAEQMRVAKIMTSLGWTHTRKRVRERERGVDRVRVWVPPLAVPT